MESLFERRRLKDKHDMAIQKTAQRIRGKKINEDRMHTICLEKNGYRNAGNIRTEVQIELDWCPERDLNSHGITAEGF